MSNLTDLLPAGAGGKQVSFVASGTLTSGQTVALNSDGTVEAIAETGGVGTGSVFESSGAIYIAATFDSNSNKVVVAYQDVANSKYGTAIVGTVSGSNISFGSPVVFESAWVEYISATFDSNSNKVVIAYTDVPNSNQGTGIVGTVSGTSISFGTATTLDSATFSYSSAVFDSNLNKVVIAYAANASTGKAVVGTVSGTSISFGTPVTFQGSNTVLDTGMCFDSSLNKIFLAFTNGSNFYGMGIVGTVSGTSISFGSIEVYRSSTCRYNSPVFDSNANKVAIAFCDTANAVLRVRLATISGTSITYGNQISFDPPTTASPQDAAATFDSNLNKIIVPFRNIADSNRGSVFAVTITGDNLAFDTTDPVIFSEVRNNYIKAVFDTNSNTTVIAYQDVLSPVQGEALTYAPLSSNNTDFIGISDAAISDTASGSVTIKGGIATDIPIGYYSLSSPSYDSKSFTPSPAINSIGVAFKTDGTKMYTLDLNGDDVAQYSLTSAWDVSTATSDSKTFDVGSQDTDPYEISFKSDGTKMYILGTANDTLYQYSLSIAWDVSTASYDSVSFSFASQTLQPYGMDFSPDGTKLYIGDYQNVRVLQYQLSTAWDVSTMSYASKLLDVSTEVASQSIYSVAVSSDGTSIFVGTHSSGNIYQYSLSSAFDVSSGSYAGVSFSTSAQEGSVTSIAFKSDGAKMYVTGFNSDTIFQYSTTTALTANSTYYVQSDGTLSTTASTVLAGKALSSTSINLDYTT
jgi:sugar lactone lactonase YvrE